MQKGYGPVRIAQELKQRGIAGDLIDTLMPKDTPEWSRRVAEVRSKRFGPRLPPDQKERLRQSRFLQYRGFSGDQIRALMHSDG